MEQAQTQHGFHLLVDDIPSTSSRIRQCRVQEQSNAHVSLLKHYD